VSSLQLGDSLQHLQPWEILSSDNKFLIADELHESGFSFKVHGASGTVSHLLLDTGNINLILQVPQEHAQVWGIAHLITPHTHDCTG
jgi:hypothetical protein